MVVGAFEVEVDGNGGFTCTECRGKRLPWRACVRLGEYEGVLRDAVHDVKFSAWRKLGRDLGRELGARLRASLGRAGIDPDRVMLVPMPTTFRRRVARGIDHTLVITRGVRELLPGAIIARPIKRRHRPSQLDVPMSRRRANVARTMTPCGVLPEPNERQRLLAVVVVDDVMTTGATMRESCRAVGKWLQTRPARDGGSDKGSDDNAPAPQVWAAVIAGPGSQRRSGDGSAPATVQQSAAEIDDH
jgi:predicted amidophosphoribosyltransferase